MHCQTSPCWQQTTARVYFKGDTSWQKYIKITPENLCHRYSARGKSFEIANSSWHWGSYGSIWTGLSPKKYYMDLKSFGPYNIFLVTDLSIYCHMTRFGPYKNFWVTDRSIYCHMTLIVMNYLLYSSRR